MTSTQFDRKMTRINDYYNQGMITKVEMQEAKDKLFNEWYSEPRDW